MNSTLPIHAEWPEGPIVDAVIRPIILHRDKRGWLGEIFRSDEIPAGIMPAMSYMSVTRPDVVRGPHEHVGQTDMFAFLGPGSFRFRLWDNRPASPTYRNSITVIVGENNPVVAVVPPGIIHGYRNVSTIDAWSLNLPNTLYQKDPSKGPPDEIRHENIAGSPFVL